MIRSREMADRSALRQNSATMQRGAKPKPTELHKLQGTLNVTRHRNRATEPIASGVLEDMEPPADLNDAERAGWLYVIEHAPKGVLKNIDRNMLMLWVQTAERYRQAKQTQDKLNAKTSLPDVVKTPGGMLVQSPYVGIMNKTALLMIRLAEQMGFSPVSRPRLIGTASAAGGSDADDGWGEFRALRRKAANGG